MSCWSMCCMSVCWQMSSQSHHLGEYATEVWTLIHKIEMVQKRVARWVLSDYRFQSSVTAVIDELGWVTLKQWRKRNRLIQLYKITNGHTPGAKIPAIYLPQTIIIRCHHHSCFVYLLPILLTTRLVSFTALLKTGMICHWTSIVFLP